MKIKTQKEIDILREGGHKLAAVMDLLIPMVKPGVTTEALEKAALKEMERLGCKPSFLGYKPSFNSKKFPTALCLSINHEIVHTPALPARTLKEGDILGIDMGLVYKNLFTDMARTVPVGKISKEATKLLNTTQEALEKAIASLSLNDTLYTIGEAVEKVAKVNDCSIIRELTGHGVGHEIHEDPHVFNFRDKESKKTKIVKGMVIAIEPMLALGKSDIVLGDDGWTYETEDCSLAAQFENTVAIGYDGKVEILTPTKWRFR